MTCQRLWSVCMQSKSLIIHACDMMVLYVIMNEHYRSAIISTAFPQGTEACIILQRALEMQQLAIQLDQIPANPLHLPCAHYSRHCCCFSCCCSVHCSCLHLHVASEALSCRLLLLYQAESQYGHALSLSLSLLLSDAVHAVHTSLRAELGWLQ